jgi:DNA modification methylase/ParB-like chromosome segregation protein Spo0J
MKKLFGVDKQIPINEIELGQRNRKEYGDIAEFALSLIEKGQLQNISVGLNPDAEKTGKPYLLAFGGRRLTAFRVLHEGQLLERVQYDPNDYATIQAKVFEKVLTELELRSLEAVENLQRKDFTYGERLEMLATLQALQVEIHGEKVSRDPDAPGWSQADTAKLLGRDRSSVSKDLKLAEAMKRAPELGLQHCKNKAEAMRVLSKFGQAVTNQTAAKAYEAETKAAGNVAVQRLINAYVVGDFFEGVKQLPDKTIDFIEIDPPYAIALQKKKKSYGYGGYNEIEPKDYPDFMQKTLKECYRVAAPNSWMVVWFGAEPWAEPMYQWITQAGFTTTRLWGCWYKAGELEDTPRGQTHMPNTRLATSFELFFYAWKGNPQLNRPGTTNGFTFKPVSPTKKYHPTQRPLELMCDLFETFIGPNKNALVPFAGSGVSLVAAHLKKIKAVGFDLTGGYKDGYVASLKEVLNVK